MPPPVVDCSKPHSDEVFSVFDYPNASGFPGYEAIGGIQQTQCQTDFHGIRRRDLGPLAHTRSTYAAPDRAGLGERATTPSTACSRMPAARQLTGSARGTRNRAASA